MAQEALAEGQLLGLGDSHLSTDSRLEGPYLAIRERHKKGFQQDDGFPQAGIQVVMGGVYRSPFSVAVQRVAVGNVVCRGAKIKIEVIYHLTEGADLVKELGAFAKQDAAPQAIAMCRLLPTGSLEISRVKGSRVGNRAVVFGVLA